MKIVYPINIDDFPPFLCHKISPDDSDESHQKIDFERHEPSERIIEDIEWYDFFSCEYGQRRKINSKGDDRRKHHHEEGIEESFHRKNNTIKEYSFLTSLSTRNSGNSSFFQRFMLG